MSASMVKPQECGSFFKPKRKFGERDSRGFPVGKRTLRRREENKKLNKLPEHIRRHCEIRRPGCLDNKFLQWCHARKSRFLLSDKDWQRAARGCASCHQTIEALPHKEMAQIVTEAIRRRKL